jgi:antitoxin component YwqK of YwqJK toxin-antitoxin module
MRSLVKINRIDIRGRKQGLWEYYYSNGSLAYKELYENGRFIKEL